MLAGFSGRQWSNKESNASQNYNSKSCSNKVKDVFTLFLKEINNVTTSTSKLLNFL